MPKRNTAESVSYAAVILAKNLDAKAIIATTRSGSTAAHIARFRPKQPIVALSPDQNAVRKMALQWGVMPFFLPEIEDTDEMVEKAAAAALEQGHVHRGQQMVITAGRPIWETGTTNMLWVKEL
jgi:pyruvate kinase